MGFTNRDILILCFLANCEIHDTNAFFHVVVGAAPVLQPGCPPLAIYGVSTGDAVGMDVVCACRHDDFRFVVSVIASTGLPASVCASHVARLDEAVCFVPVKSTGYPAT